MTDRDLIQRIVDLERRMREMEDWRDRDIQLAEEMAKQFDDFELMMSASPSDRVN